MIDERELSMGSIICQFVPSDIKELSRYANFDVELLEKLEIEYDNEMYSYCFL